MFSYSCDADPTVLAQYIIALIGDEDLDDRLKSSLEEKLHEFFDDRKFLFLLLNQKRLSFLLNLLPI